jgi:N-acetylhexosamine 1-kinase
MDEGSIRTVAVHGDTKLENFLFSRECGRVRSLVDLDTIMPHTWLSDWGDMVRSLANVAGEKEADLNNVQVDLDIIDALARGFLGSAGEIPPAELELMPIAVEVLALELGVRFLMDYLRGDSYFVLGPQDRRDLNKIRGMVQLTLFERLREKRSAIESSLRQSAPVQSTSLQ